MTKGKKNEAVLYRVVKFEIHPNAEQLALLRQVSDNLMLVWNEALEERQRLFTQHHFPLYEAMKTAGEHELVKLRAALKAAYVEHRVTLFDQINALTPRRRKDEGFARVPRNWQEETLDTLNGAYSSFLALRKNKDMDARPPRLRGAWDFHEIPGRHGFKILPGFFVLSPGGNKSFSFPIPEHQQKKLADALRVKKFTLFRDERDMRKPGRFWISVAYEIHKMKEIPFDPNSAVYVSLGASSFGVVSPKGEEVLSLWRPDKYWKPKIDAVEARMQRCAKGSKTWHKRNAARLTMLRRMAFQQKQDQREAVARDLLRHGVHFVVSDVSIRSKKGKLADASKQERSGSLGLNWAAQNTGSMAYLVLWLEEKAKERGGSVRRHRLTGVLPLGQGEEVKIPMARALRESYIAFNGTS